MKLIVSNTGQQAHLTLSGMGKSQVVFDFDEVNQILKQISFVDIHGWPKLLKSTVKNVKTDKNKDIRHIKSRQWIKNKIKRIYEDKDVYTLVEQLSQNVLENLDYDFKRFFISPSPAIQSLGARNLSHDHYLFVAAKIAIIYLNAIRDINNIYCGDKNSNNFAGKLSMILKPHVEAGKDAFPQDKPLIISLSEKIKLSGYEDFYESLRKELCAGITETEDQYLEIPTWDNLLEIFFALNYDHPYLATNGKGTYKQFKAEICEAKKEYLNIFQRFGSYDWDPKLFNAHATNLNQQNVVNTNASETNQNRLQLN